jgi:hypothetical protein
MLSDPLCDLAPWKKQSSVERMIEMNGTGEQG